MVTFAEHYRRTHGLPRENSRGACSGGACTGHRRALLVAPAVMLFDPRYFAPDFELLNGVGRLTDVRSLDGELRDYDSPPWNLGFLRRRLRLSGRRVIRQVRRGLTPPMD